MMNFRSLLVSATFALSTLSAVAQTQIAVLPYFIDESYKNSVRVFVHEAPAEYEAVSITVAGKDQVEQAIDIFVSMFRKRHEAVKDFARAHMKRIGQIGDTVVYAINLNKYSSLNELFRYMYPKYVSVGFNALVKKAEKDKELFGKEIDALLQDVVLCSSVQSYFA